MRGPFQSHSTCQKCGKTTFHTQSSACFKQTICGQITLDRPYNNHRQHCCSFSPTRPTALIWLSQISGCFQRPIKRQMSDHLKMGESGGRVKSHRRNSDLPSIASQCAYSIASPLRTSTLLGKNLVDFPTGKTVMDMTLRDRFHWLALGVCFCW